MSFAYNPHLVSYDALLATFVGREALVGQIARELREADSPQHHLVVGPRGIGKTTLLLRIAAEIERDAALSARWMPLTFPEEQYNVATLSDLWLNCLDALTDAADRAGDRARVDGLEAFVQSLEGSEERRAALALDRLREEAAGGRGLVLLIDNLQQVLHRLHKHQWALRQVLSDTPGLVVIAACPSAVGTGYGEAFYDFFLAHPLRSFGDDQLAALLLRLAEQAGQPAVAEAVQSHPGRLRAMRVLTGGSPRTAVLLFSVLVTKPEASVRDQVEGLIDQVTPLYKARVEELADQAQLVLDVLAQHWDPTTAAELGERANLQVAAVSTQLLRLVDAGLVEKVDLPIEARQGFQIAERFFNVWYLMRASRRLRGRLLALARCLECLYAPEVLETLATELIAGTGADVDLLAAMSMATAHAKTQYALAARALEVAKREGRAAELAVQVDRGSLATQLSRQERVERARRWAEKNPAPSGLDAELRLVFVILGLYLIETSIQSSECNETARRDTAAPSVQWHSAEEFGLFVEKTMTKIEERLGIAKQLMEQDVWDGYLRAIINGHIDQALTEPLTQFDFEVAAHHLDLPQLIGWNLAFQCIYFGVELNSEQWVRVRQARDRATAVALIGYLIEVVPTVLFSGDLKRARSLSAGISDSRHSLALHPLTGVVSSLLQSLLDIVDSPSRGADVFFREVEAALLQDGDNVTPPQAYAPIFLSIAAALAPRAPHVTLQLTELLLQRIDPVSILPTLERLFHSLIRDGQLATAATIGRSLAPVALPLHAALVAVEGGDAALLGRFAPEVAIPAREILDRIWPAETRPSPANKRGPRTKPRRA